MSENAILIGARRVQFEKLTIKALMCSLRTQSFEKSVVHNSDLLVSRGQNEDVNTMN